MAGECLVYSQGQTATLTAQFVTSPSGMPIDVPDAMIEILDGPNSIVPITPMVPTIALTGYYYYDWVIPNSLPVKSYTIRYTGTVQGTPTAAIDTINIVLAGTNTGASTSQKTIELVAALESYIGCAQNIPVYNETARRSATKTVYKLTWPRWNLGNHNVFLNDDEITDGFGLNSESGTISFTAPMADTDRVQASYNFRFFTQKDMIRFLADALNQINYQPPGTNFTLDSMPDIWSGALMMGASKNAIKRLMFCLNFQEPSTIFGGKERTGDVFSNLNALKENNETEFEKEKKNIKIARYPSTLGVVQPEYTLPGGRCLTHDTLLHVLGSNKNHTIKEAYERSMDGEKIFVLSDLGRSKAYCLASKVWKSGKKKIINIKASGIELNTSPEHLIFSNGEYRPAFMLKADDHIRVLENNRIKDMRISKIRKTNVRVQMYDMEVPFSSNFYANGVLCHNSRWFRYLFSGGTG